MIRNYLLTAIRSLQRNKWYTLINILGLMIGLAGSILILLWIQYEYSYNQFASNHQNIYQVKVNVTYNGTVNTIEDNTAPVYHALRQADTRIKNTCITSSTYGHTLKFQEIHFSKEVMGVSPEFLEMFGIPILNGSYRSLDDPNSIMLNETTARELFGDIDPINQFVTFDNNTDLKVTGIFKDVPDNSEFWFHALVPINFGSNNGWLPKEKDKWDEFYPRIYAEVTDQSAIENINARIKNIIKEHFNDRTNPELFLHAMDRWHLHDKFLNGKESGGRIEYVQLFTGIAILILLIACINYMSLSTARSEGRAREVGIRKSIGSRRSQLTTQFLLESFLVSSIACILAILLVQLCLPWYSNLIHFPVFIDYQSISFWLYVIAIIGITGLLSGAYPAFYFSSFQPVKVLKGKIYIGRNGGMPRKIMVTTQYVISIFLIIGMIVIYEQIQYVKQRDLGYNKENLLCVAFNDQIAKNYNAIKNELLTSGVAADVTRANEGIDVDYFTDYVEWSGKQSEEKIQFSRISTDSDFIKTNQIRILEGRDFSSVSSGDTANVLINETAAALLRMKNPIGEKIRTQDGDLTIIGIVEDVVKASPFDPIAPAYIGILGDPDNHLTIRLANTDDVATSLEKIDAILKKLDPLNNDEVEFVNDRLAYGFRGIELIGQLANLFAFLGIFLTCLGVLGLAAFTAEQRTKEFAIRKILGAGLDSLLMLLSGYFIRIVVAAIFIASPLSWWVMDNYIQRYAYRIDVPWWSVPLTGISILAITLLLVALQVFKTLESNPVKSLKSE